MGLATKKAVDNNSVAPLVSGGGYSSKANHSRTVASAPRPPTRSKSNHSPLLRRALKKSPFLRTKTENVTIYNFSFYKSP